MKSSKKPLTMILCVSIILSLFTSVSAQEFSQPDVVNIFDTIYGYQRERVKQNGVLPNLPAGLTSAKNQVSACNGLTSEVADDGSHYVRVSNETVGSYANPEWVFDEVIRKGTLTLSFDMYYPWDAAKAEESFNNLPYVYMDLINASVNDNPTDRWTADNNEPGHDQLFTINESHSQTVFKVGDKTTPIADSIANRWNKITISINAETGYSVIYLNGTEFASRNMSNKGIKMLNLNVSTYKTDVIGEVLFDNFYVRHTQSDLSEITAGADYKIGGAAADGGKIRMSFSETLNLFKGEEELYANDFVVKNSDGEGVEGAIKNVERAEKKKAELIFTVQNLKKGTYTIEISDDVKNGEDADLYKGVISGNFPESITFATMGDEQNNVGTRRYYVNEDFESYNGGHPNGALQNSFYGMNNANNMVAVANEGGKNFAFENSDSAIWKFDEPFMGGKLFIEFDVKANANVGKWSLNLLKARDFLSEDYVPGDYWEVYLGRASNTVVTPQDSKDAEKYKYYSSQWNAAYANDSSLDEETWRNGTWPGIWQSYRNSTDTAAVESRKQSRIKSIERNVGIGTSNDATKFSYAKDRTGSAPTDVADTFPKLTQGEWKHVKVEIDTEAGQYVLTVDGQVVRLDYDLANFIVGGGGSHPAYATSYNINTGKLKITPGFGGISFNAEGQEKVELDNVQIYTEDSYNSYSDFNNVAENSAAQVISETTGLDVKCGPNMPDWYTNMIMTMDHSVTNRSISLSKGEGRNYATDPSDKALLINCGTKKEGYLLHPFNVPVKNDRDFTVEFDYKSTSDQPMLIGLVESGNTGVYRFDTLQENSNMVGMIEDTLCNGSNHGTHDPCSIRRTMVTNGGTHSNSLAGNFGFRSGRSVWMHEEYQDATNGTNVVAYKKGEWHHIKLDVTTFYQGTDPRIQLQLTVTYEDGTSMTSQKFATKVSRANADVAAMIFQFNGGGTQTNFRHFIDNFKVYEVGGSVYNPYMTSVVAKDVNGNEEAVNDSIKQSTTELLVNFSHRLSNTDGISIFKSNGEEVAATKTLSEDKLSAVVSLNEVLAPDEKVTVKVSSDQEFDEKVSYLHNMEASAKTFTVTADVTDPVNIEELRLYKWFDKRKLNNWELYSGEGYYPLGAAELVDLSAGDKYKVVIKGSNYSGEAKTISFIKATYKGNVLENIEIIPKDVPEGPFDVSEEITFTDGTTGRVKYFIWNGLNDLTSLADNLDYEMTVTATGE